MKFLLILSVFMICRQGLAIPPYPILVEGKGQVLVATAREEKMIPMQNRQILREKAKIELAPGAQVTLLLDEKRKLILQDEASLSLPGISWESGEAPILIIEKGSLRWMQKNKGDYNVVLRSPLFEFIPPAADFVVRMNPEKAFAEMLVVSGQVEFQAMNAETAVTLHSGQKAHFQGVIENDEIAYDVLLKGRKIPKGKLSAATAFNQEDSDRYSEEVQRKKEESEKKKAAQKIADENKLLPGQICRHPNAKLNECAWTCDKNPKKEKKSCRLDLPEVQCVRQRCNANGLWAESTILDKDQGRLLCGVKAIVRKCDY